MDSNSNQPEYEVTINAEVTTYQPAVKADTIYVRQKNALPGQIAANNHYGQGKVNNSYQGPRTYTYYNGDTYTGGNGNGHRDGYGTYRWANGSQYIGYFANNKRNGAGVYYGSNGRVLSGYWMNDMFVCYARFAPSRSSNSQSSYTASSARTGTQAVKNNYAAGTPPDKLTIDQANFAKEVEAQQQKQQ